MFRSLLWYSTLKVIYRKVKKLVLNCRAWILRKFLVEKDFSIVSDNCWGGFVYQYFNIQYNSPFIGLYIFSADYIKLLKSLDDYLAKEIIFIEPSQSRFKEKLIEDGTYGTYPIGVLGGDIEIHFLHYSNAEEALDKWTRRLSRINKDKLLIKFCDRDYCTSKHIAEFHLLGFKRKVFLSAKEWNYNCCYKLNGEEGEYISDEWKSFLKTKSPLSFMNKLFS